jgi:hypothetical protein
VSFSALGWYIDCFFTWDFSRSASLLSSPSFACEILTLMTPFCENVSHARVSMMLLPVANPIEVWVVSEQLTHEVRVNVKVKPMHAGTVSFWFGPEQMSLGSTVVEKAEKMSGCSVHWLELLVVFSDCVLCSWTRAWNGDRLVCWPKKEKFFLNRSIEFSFVYNYNYYVSTLQ